MSDDKQRTGAADDLDRLLRRSYAGGRRDDASAECVDGETLAAWIEGGLARAEMSRVELHLSDCARCQAMLAAFAETEPTPASAVGAAPVSKAWLSWPVKWLAPLAATAGAILVWAVVRSGPAETTLPVTSVARVEEKAEAPALEREQAPMPGAEAAPNQPARADEAAVAMGGRAALESRAEALPPAGGLARDDSRSRESGEARALASPPAAPAAVVPQASPAISSQEVPRGAGAQVAAARPEPISADAKAVELPSQRAAAGLANLAPGQVVVVEFGIGANALEDRLADSTAPAPPAPASAARGESGPRPVGAGRGGAAAFAPRAPAGSIRWRILENGRVVRLPLGSTNWVSVELAPEFAVTGGVAPSPTVCWLIGPGGLVLRSTDGERFARVALPAGVDPESITATSAQQARIVAVGGRVLATTDGGASWR